MICKHENISAGVFRDDVGPLGWKLSGSLDIRTTVTSKTARSAVEVHLVWHDIYVASKTGRRVWTAVFYTVRMCKITAEDRGSYIAMHMYYRNNISANKPNRDAQTGKRSVSVCFIWNYVLKKKVVLWLILGIIDLTAPSPSTSIHNSFEYRSWTA
jgi:hypothetical protein